MAQQARTWLAIGTLGVVAIVSTGCGASGVPAATAGPTSVPVSAAPATTTPTIEPTLAPPATPVTALDVASTISGFSGAADIAATEDAVWVLDHSDSSLWPIDPTTGQMGTPIDVASVGGASNLEVLDGQLWVIAQESGDVVAIEAVEAKVVGRVPVGGLDGGVMSAGDGAIWAIRAGGQEAVGRDPTTRKVTATLPLPAVCGTTPLAAGGFLWVADTPHGASLQDRPRVGHGPRRARGRRLPDDPWLGRGPHQGARPPRVG